MVQFLRRLYTLARRRRLESDLAAELEFHLAMKQLEFEGSGLDSADASFAAQRALGNRTLAQEDACAVWLWPWVEGVWQDTSHMCRTVRRQPAFAFVAVLTLTLGIGANTAIFSVIDTLLVRPPAVAHVDRLVWLHESNREKIPFDVNPSPGNFLDWRQESRAFDHLAAWRNWYFTLAEPRAGDTAPEAVRGVRVSPAFFSMLDVHVPLGRIFDADEEQEGKHQTVLLSDGLWRRRFGADRTIVGRILLIDGAPFSVVGVLPPDFHFLQPDLDVWMPLAVDEAFHDRENHSVMVFGRLAPGVTVAQGQAEMDAIASRMANAYPDTNRGWTVKVATVYPTSEVQALRPALLVLAGAAGLVLLIACANVANLLLARGIARQREIEVRVALGATRPRIVRQLLTETLVLATLAGGAGVIAGYLGVTVLVPLLPHLGTNKSVGSFRAVSATLDLRMAAFSFVVALLTGVIVGAMPAFRAARVGALRTSTMSAHRSRGGRVLMAVELGIAIVLLTGAALLTESFWRLQHVDPGFRGDHLLTMQVWLPKTKYTTADEIRRFYDQAVRAVNSVPGVVGASAISYRPFLNMGNGAAVEIEGHAPSRAGQHPAIEYRVVTPGFIRVLGQPLVAGRDFTEHDDARADGVVIVNETLAHRYWPDGDAIGRRLRPAFRRSVVPWEMDASPRWLMVVGVVRDIKGLAPDDRDQSQLYISSSQFPSSYMFLVIRTASAPLVFASAIQERIRGIDPNQPVSDVRTMEEAVSAALPRFNVEILAVFALIAIVLAAVGVYGVSAYAVHQRTQEIGVRVALGAQSRDVLTMIMQDAIVAGAAGAGAGLIAALALSRTLSGLLYGVAPTDPPAYFGAAFLLLMIVLIACYIPARRAARLDPAVTLRA
jgi:predicted permease